jgi:hypothetical protein
MGRAAQGARAGRGRQGLERADPDMTQLIGRLGLTPRKPLKVAPPPPAPPRNVAFYKYTKICTRIFI